jgi:hypothetical protein
MALKTTPSIADTAQGSDLSIELDESSAPEAFSANDASDGSQCKNLACFRGMLLCLPVSILMWIFIIWGIKTLFF